MQKQKLSIQENDHGGCTELRTLICQALTESEGIISAQEIEIPDGISWELRFYCNSCANEIEESEVTEHNCKENKE